MAAFFLPVSIDTAPALSVLHRPELQSAQDDKKHQQSREQQTKDHG